jgi:SAM-dependent methyltransferase
MELTEIGFWEGYWSRCTLPNTVNFSAAFDRCLAQTLQNKLKGLRGEVLEIGCAPGKWLVFLAREIGLKPSGIEYTSAGMKATLRNFDMLGVESGFVRDGDFFQIEPQPRFDVVISLGFIEHFLEIESVFRRHLEWLKPGGTLVIGVPNFRGIYGPIQAVLDKTILDKHNLKIMSPEALAELGNIQGLRIESIDYLGSFEPDLPMQLSSIKSPLQLIVKTILWLARRVRRSHIWDQWNNPLISSYLLAVYHKDC